MSVGAVSGVSSATTGVQTSGDVQTAVAVKALKMANEQSDAVLSLIEGAAETAEAVSADGHVDITA